MFRKFDEQTVLESRIRLLELRRRRLLSQSQSDDENSIRWVQSDVLRLDKEIQEAKAHLADRHAQRI